MLPTFALSFVPAGPPNLNRIRVWKFCFLRKKKKLGNLEKNPRCQAGKLHMKPSHSQMIGERRALTQLWHSSPPIPINLSLEIFKVIYLLLVIFRVHDHLLSLASPLVPDESGSSAGKTPIVAPPPTFASGKGTVQTLNR